MANDTGMIVPEIDDADIAWVCGLLGLPATAFSGLDGTDPRLPIIRSMDTLDIEACPGSGKTTLLVAKLAILARKWTDSRRGLCVLSHTNVARREIETRLGNTAAGQRLLGYPHFIGTIHGFANEFLALPWIRSLGYPIEMIDDEVCLHRRWRKLSPPIQSGLEQNHHTEQVLRFRDAEFGLGEIRWGKGRLGPDTPTYQAMLSACEASAQEGYFCHDEMFVWAHDMLDVMPSVGECLRTRFPFLFIDEVQDNSELQSKLLYRVFVDGDYPVMRQRLGDTNQAIYQYAGQVGDTGLDAFPIAKIRTDMPNSFRFDQSIANLADPLAVEPQSLQGLRQRGADGIHAILLFDDDTIGHVIERYSEYLTNVFSESELRNGSFAAIGAVHRPGDNDNAPRSVGHYWAAYDYEISSAEPQPKSFVQYVAAGNRLAQPSGEANALVEKVADGFLRLIKLSNPDLKLRERKRRHRYVLELLGEQTEEKELYLDLVRTLCVDRAPLTRSVWEEDWRDAVAQIAAVISGAELGAEAQEFLAWDDASDPVENGGKRGRSDNIFRYPADHPVVEVRIGSIHSVKGETHTATLVLDTFYRSHHLKMLKAWLIGEKSGGGGESPSLQSRLRLHYVAMSRPSDLLCLAMRGDALTEVDIEKIIGNGWRVGQITSARIEWLRSRIEIAQL